VTTATVVDCISTIFKDRAAVPHCVPQWQWSGAEGLSGEL